MQKTVTPCNVFIDTTEHKGSYAAIAVAISN